MNELHIVVASDNNYSRFVATLIASIVYNNTSFELVNFHILNNGITHENLEKILTTAKQFDKCKIYSYDIGDLETKLGISVPSTIAVTSYARLFMADILPSYINRVLYLDTDIIATDDLSKLWNSFLGENYLGGCLDVFSMEEVKTSIGLSKQDPYINAGMLLINLELWRRINIKKQFIEFLKIHNGKVMHHDQGIINGVSKNKLTILPPEFNVHSIMFCYNYKIITKMMNPYYLKREFDSALKKPSLIHFTEGFYNRPWKKNCRHPLRSEFIKYNSMTPWKDEPLLPDNRSIKTKIIALLFHLLPYRLFKLIVR